MGKNLSWSDTGQAFQEADQLLGFGSPRARQVADMPMGHHGDHAGHHGDQVFIGHGTENRMGLGIKAHRIQVLKQSGNRMGVVRHIQYQSGLSRQGLESARQLNQGQTIAHGLGRDRQALTQGFKQGQYATGIEQLIGTPARLDRPDRGSAARALSSATGGAHR